MKDKSATWRNYLSFHILYDFVALKINNHVKNHNIWLKMFGGQNNRIFQSWDGAYGLLGYGLELKLYSPRPRYMKSYMFVTYIMKTDI